MRLQKATCYGLYAALDMAAAGGEPVTVQEVASRWGVPAAACAKAVQRLVRAGIAVGTRGARGGCRLVRPPARISVQDIVAAFEPPHAPEPCSVRDGDGKACTAAPDRRLMHLFHEVDEVVRCTYASVTLATLAGVGPEIGAGSAPASAPAARRVSRRGG